METNIQKWGNSLGVRLPKQLALKQSLKAGTKVLVTETKTGVSIELVKSPKKNLKQLLSSITVSNLHNVTDWGAPAGKEVW